MNPSNLRLLFICLICFASSPSTFAQLSSEDEDFIQRIMTEHNVPGLGIAIVTEGKISYVKSFGVKDVRTKEAISDETLFQAASISKPVAATLIMRNVQAGKVKLDEPINTYLDSWKLKPYKNETGRVATVRQLLSHTGGTNMSGFLGYKQNKSRIPSLEEVLKGKKVHLWEKKIKHKFAPNERFSYSGGGYCVLEKAIEDFEGKTFSALMQEEVLRPCGMNSSFYSYKLTKEQEQKITTGHKKNGKPIKADYHVYPQMAAAGLWTTPRDLAHFLIEIQKSLNGSSEAPLLSQEMMKEIATIRKLDSGSTSTYGLGFQLMTDDKGQVYGLRHTGANWGFSCRMYTHISSGKAVVIMSNRNYFATSLIANRINERIGFEEE